MYHHTLAGFDVLHPLLSTVWYLLRRRVCGGVTSLGYSQIIDAVHCAVVGETPVAILGRTPHGSIS